MPSVSTTNGVANWTILKYTVTEEFFALSLIVYKVLVDAIVAESCVVGALLALVHTGSAGIFRSAVLAVGACHSIDTSTSSSFGVAFRTDALVINFDVAKVGTQSTISRVVAAVGAAVMTVVAPAIPTVVSALGTPDLAVVLAELAVPELIRRALLWNAGLLTDPVILLLPRRTPAVDPIVSHNKRQSAGATGARLVFTLLAVGPACCADAILPVLAVLTPIFDARVIGAFVSKSCWALAVPERVDVKACFASVALA